MRGSILAVVLVVMVASCARPADEGGGSADGSAAPVASNETASAQTAPSTPLPDKVNEAVEIARAIEADPDQASRILEEHGMSQEEFEALMYDIAQDPSLSRAYDEAMSR